MIKKEIKRGKDLFLSHGAGRGTQLSSESRSPASQ